MLVEAAATNAREVEIGVLQGLDGGRPETSAIAEITVAPEHTFYDFEAKYLEQSYQIPASLDEDVDRAGATTSPCGPSRRSTSRALPGWTSSCSRDGRVVVNEVETMPGFTATSMFPLLWQESGLTYPELVERLVRLAMERSTGLR